MKILFLLTQSLDSPSGLGRYWPLSKELVKLKHNVTIIALHPDINILSEKEMTIDGVKIVYVSQMHIIKHGNTKTYFSTTRLSLISIQATFRIFAAAFKESADLIHICKPHPMNGLAGFFVGHLQGIPVWLDCDDYEAASGRFSSRIQQKVVAWFEKHLPNIANSTTTNTHFMQQKLISWGIPAQKVIILPNGVAPDRFSQPLKNEVEALLSQLDLQGNPVVLYVGSLSLPSHPIDLLLGAFVIIHKNHPGTKLVVVGGGEEYVHLQQIARERGISESVRFCGRVSAERVVLYYHLANVSVDPVYDNDAARGRSPLKLFESWVCGLPFVTGDVGDRRILLGDPPAGLLAKPGDPASLAVQIQSVLSNPYFADEIRHRGLERVKAYYWDQIAITLNQAYLTE